MGFTFDRLGMRVATFAASAWIPEHTVVTSQYQHTSLIRTLREHWSLGPPLTARDATASDITPVLSLDTPRPPEDWPEVTPRPVPPFDPKATAPHVPLRSFSRVALFGALALAKHLGLPTPGLAADEDISRADGLAILADVLGATFPHLGGE
jgi:phospholipase C